MNVGFKRLSLAAVVLSASVFQWPAPAAATMNSTGTEFWLGFPRNNTLDSVSLTLFITARQDTSGTVAVPGLSFSVPFSVEAGTVTAVDIPVGAMAFASDTVESKGINLTAEDAVTVYGLNRKQFTTDAYLGLPLDILGTEHIVLSYRNIASTVTNQTQFLIVGTVDETTVSITPSATTDTRPAGVPYEVILDAGDTYLLGNILTTGDLSGTLISSSAPVAVFGSHSCANIPPGNNACDHLIEQLPPVSAWGQEFVTIPLATRTRGDTFRFLAAADGTSVSVDGVVVANLNRGQFHERLIAENAEISASAPILVAQYSNGTEFDGVVSDPFMMLIPPFEQYLGSYTVTTPASGFRRNFINVVAPNAVVGAITRNGVPIPAESFAAIGDSGFSGVQVEVALGSHSLDGPLPFGVFMYGFDLADSYGYPGGQSLAAVAVVTSVAVTPENSDPAVGGEQCVTARVSDQDGNPLEGVRVDFAVTGANPMSTFRFADANGEAELCYVGANVGIDTIVASVGSLSDGATIDWQVAPPITTTPTRTAPGSTTVPTRTTPTPTPTETGPCVGDCDGDGSVTVDELVRLVTIALGRLPLLDCIAGDANRDGVIRVNEIVAAVNNALEGC